jgi:hypothetical protein
LKPFLGICSHLIFEAAIETLELFFHVNHTLAASLSSSSTSGSSSPPQPATKPEKGHYDYQSDYEKCWRWGDTGKRETGPYRQSGGYLCAIRNHGRNHDAQAEIEISNLEKPGSDSRRR